MNALFSPPAVILLVACIAGVRPMRGAETPPTANPSPARPAASLVGLELGTLELGTTTYHAVRVRSLDTRSLFFLHRDGLGSVRLRDLPPEVQARLGYDPASASPEAPAPVVRVETPPAPVVDKTAQAATTDRLEQLFLAYDSTPEVRGSQSLQGEFIRLNLGVKNQGRRPSCAIYAIVGALEFQNSRLSGGLEKLSEEYLIWATRRSVGGVTALTPRDETGEPTADAGYTLPSVIGALQTYGIPRYEDMPNLPGLPVEAVPAPSPEIVARARARRRVFIAALPGGEPAALVNSLVHALNADFPVPAALRWPNENAINAGVLAGQRPMADALHAVTFVGYHCPTGRLEDASFVFKNSYGPHWGQGGYGRATWGYLSRHLLEAYVLDVRAPGPSS